MSKIKIDDLPKDEAVSEEEMKKVTGGAARKLPTMKTSLGGVKSSACGCTGMSQDPVT